MTRSARFREGAVMSCVKCRKGFESLKGFKIHYGQNHKKATRPCRECGDEYEYASGSYELCIDCSKELLWNEKKTSYYGEV